MAGRPSFAWWLTEKGQRAAAFVMSGACSLVVAVQLLPHSMLIKEYINLIRMYRNGEPVPVPEELLKEASEVIDKCELTELQKLSFKYYTPLGFDVVHVGSTNLSRGSYLGIPYSFRYKNTQEIDFKSLLIKGSNYNFDSDVGHILLSSFVLSDNARKFAIAREVYSSVTQQPYLNAGITFISLFTTYSCSRIFNQRMNFYVRPRSIRMVLYGLASGFGLVAYFLFKDIATVYYDRRADELACSLGADYCRGGVEFYQKILQRNVGLREALGDLGKRKYTSYGNEEMLFRTKRRPISDRLENVKSRLKEYEKPTETHN